MKLISKLVSGGYHPATGLSLPPEGQEFEADDERGAELVSAGLAAQPRPPRAVESRPHRAAEKEE